jgi:hypothetical protein
MLCRSNALLQSDGRMMPASILRRDHNLLLHPDIFNTSNAMRHPNISILFALMLRALLSIHWFPVARQGIRASVVRIAPCVVRPNMTAVVTIMYGTYLPTLLFSKTRFSLAMRCKYQVGVCFTNIPYKSTFSIARSTARRCI